MIYQESGVALPSFDRPERSEAMFII
jgi:hypothetical protein